jgi:hypothetical protein
MSKYFLITVTNQDGKSRTFVEEGNSVFSAFMNKLKATKEIEGWKFPYNTSSITFAQEASKEDYGSYSSHKNAM